VAASLYRLGRFCFHRRGRVVAVWLLLLAVLGIAAAVFRGPASDQFTMPGTESQRALSTLQHEFPQAAGASGTIVVASTTGKPLTPKQVRPVLDQAEKVPGVSGAVSPFAAHSLTRDGATALVAVQFSTDTDKITDAQRSAYEHVGDSLHGLRVEHADLGTEAPDVGSTEAIGVIVAAVVLVITFGSLVAAGMTLLNALIGVGAGMAGLYALSSVVELTSVAPILALMLGLAVGIDYSLFITSRYRQFLADGMDPREAAGRAIGTAGSAVVFAGATVVIALAGLSVVGIPFLTVMGLAAAGTIAVAVLVALTLLPAVLGFAGERVLRRSQRSGHKGGERAAPREGFGFAWGRIVTRLRIPIVIVGVLGLGALALPAQDMRLALPDASTQSVGTPGRDAYDLISKRFGEGVNGRLVAVITSDHASDTATAVGRAAAAINGADGVRTVTTPQFNRDHTAAMLPIIPDKGPTDAATERAVHDIRDRVAGIGGARIELTGQTAQGIDVSDKLADALPIYLLLVVGLSFLLLMLVFRSILVPLKAALGFLLTVGATFGITVAVFQQGHLAGLIGLETPGPLVSFLPILLIGILFGLAMDYEVFLVSRMREDFVHGGSARRATISGLGHNAKVVTAAALIMTAVFGGFTPTSNAIIKSIGFALAVGVVVDAFIVRMTIVPAVMSLLGRAAWWLPRWLSWLLPNLDVEGAALAKDDDGAAPPRERELAER
jgi:RND superfamily putative drug exporter